LWLTPENEATKFIQDARTEWVLQITGVVRRRPEGAQNPNLATGEIEVAATKVEVLNPAKPIPFMINKDEDTRRIDPAEVSLSRPAPRTDAE